MNQLWVPEKSRIFPFSSLVSFYVSISSYYFVCIFISYVFLRNIAQEIGVQVPKIGSLAHARRLTAVLNFNQCIS